MCQGGFAMRRLTCLLGVLLLTGCAGMEVTGARTDPTGRPPTKEEREEIDQVRWQFADYYGKGDAAALGGLFAEHARFAGTVGAAWQEGREAIRGNWDRLFKAFPTRGIDFRPVSIWVYEGNQIAVETGFFGMRMAAGDAMTSNARYSIVWMKVGGPWLILHLHSSRLPAAP